MVFPHLGMVPRRATSHDARSEHRSVVYVGETCAFADINKLSRTLGLSHPLSLPFLLSGFSPLGGIIWGKAKIRRDGNSPFSGEISPTPRSLAHSPLFWRRDVCLLPRYTRCASRRLSSDAEKRPGFSRLKKNTSLLCSTLLDLLGLISVAFCVFPGLFSRTRRRGGIEPTSNYCTKATLFLDRGFV